MITECTYDMEGLGRLLRSHLLRIESKVKVPGYLFGGVANGEPFDVIYRVHLIFNPQGKTNPRNADLLPLGQSTHTKNARPTLQ